MKKWMACMTALGLIANALVMTAQADEKAASGNKVKLEIEYPAAMFTGTPKDLKSKFLEPPRPPGPRPALMVPEGLKNVALKKKVTASDSEPVIGELALVTDGDKEGTDGSYVEFGPGKQWVQVDLGQEYEIHAIAVWHYHSEGRIYRGVVIQVSDDPDFIKNVTTVFNNDQNNSLGLGAGKDYEYIEDNYGRAVDAKGVKGRYVRLYSKGNTSNEMNHYTEVEVYGK